MENTLKTLESNENTGYLQYLILHNINYKILIAL